MPSPKFPSTVNVHEAKTHFSKLLAGVARGQEVVVAKSGKPVARIVPFAPLERRRPKGWERVDIPDSAFFDSLPDDEIGAWEGRDTDE